MQPKLVIVFKPLNEADFQAEVGTILVSVTDNPDFQQPWPDSVPLLEYIKAAYEAYMAAYHASLSRDRFKIAERDAARETLTELLKYLANYLKLVAKGDVAKFQTTVYKLRKDIVRSIHGGVLPVPLDFKATHGPRSGDILLPVAKLPGAKSYEVKITEGDPASAMDWQSANLTANAFHIPIEDLIAGHAYWFRIRTLGSGGEGIWSDPISLKSP
jgi:hypothetical protein